MIELQSLGGNPSKEWDVSQIVTQRLDPDVLGSGVQEDQQEGACGLENTGLGFQVIDNSDSFGYAPRFSMQS